MQSQGALVAVIERGSRIIEEGNETYFASDYFAANYFEGDNETYFAFDYLADNYFA